MIVSEGARVPRKGNGRRSTAAEVDAFGHVRLGGVGNAVAKMIEDQTAIRDPLRRPGPPPARRRAQRLRPRARDSGSGSGQAGELVLQPTLRHDGRPLGHQDRRNEHSAQAFPLHQVPRTWTFYSEEAVRLSSSRVRLGRKNGKNSGVRRVDLREIFRYDTITLARRVKDSLSVESRLRWNCSEARSRRTRESTTAALRAVRRRTLGSRNMKAEVTPFSGWWLRPIESRGGIDPLGALFDNPVDRASRTRKRSERTFEGSRRGCRQRSPRLGGASQIFHEAGERRAEHAVGWSLMKIVSSHSAFQLAFRRPDELG